MLCDVSYSMASTNDTSEKTRKTTAKFFIFCQNKKKKSIKCYRNCNETIMDVLLNFGPNWKRNDEEIIEKFQC